MSDPMPPTPPDSPPKPAEQGMSVGRQLAILGILALLLMGWFYYRWQSLQAPDRLRTEMSVTLPSVKVQVQGDVERPGAYEMPAGSLVRELIEKAGPKLKLETVPTTWLDMPLRSGLKVEIWNRAEGGPQVAVSRQDGATMGLLLLKLDVNTATAAELAALPELGEKTAAAIVAFREANGPFRSLEDLMAVKGVGEKTVESLRFQVVVGAAGAQAFPPAQGSPGIEPR